MSCRLAACLVLLASPALAQTRPLLTEEAGTAPAGTLVLEVGGDYVASEPNYLTGRERDRWDAPNLRLVWSPAATVELDLEWTGRVGARDDPDFGSVSDFGDVVLRAKARLVEERRGRPGLAARFGVALPETTFGNGLGPDTLRMSAQLLLSKEVGPVAVHVNAGLAIQDRPLAPHQQSDFLAYGLAITGPAGRRLTMVAEVNGLGGGRGAPGADRHAEARAGFRYGTGRVRFDAALRRGLLEGDGTWGVTAGFRYAIR